MTTTENMISEYESLRLSAEDISSLMVCLADNEIDGDTFAVVSAPCENGAEYESDLSITETALRASVIINKILAALEVANSKNYQQQMFEWIGRYEALRERIEKSEPGKNITDDQRWCPTVDAITGRKLFMWLSHPDLGYVPTYGGPYDSYTLTERDSDGELYVHRYDHDQGEWVENVCIELQVVENTLPSDQSELEKFVMDSPQVAKLRQQLQTND